MKRIIFLYLLVCNVSLGATFIGNGGTVADVELLVTVNHIKETFLEVANSADNLCVCEEIYELHSVCEPLKNLTPEQVKYCADSVKKKAPEILDLLKRIDNVEFQWTTDKIEVVENGQRRPVDAVTDYQQMKITIQQDRFLEMKTHERSFLLTHELLHLGLWDEKPLVDRGAVGPFTGSDGGRKFLNAISAASVMSSSEDYVFEKYKGALRRSRAAKNAWVDIGVQGVSEGRKTQTTFSMDEFTFGQIGLRYYFGKLGVIASYRSGKAIKKVLSTIDAVERQKIYGIGLSYKYLPFSNPLTYWGQSYLTVNAQYEFLSAHYEAHDEFVGFDDKASSEGLGINITYYFPIVWNFWATAGLGYQTHTYKYDAFNLEYDKNQFSGTIGVSYGF